MERHAAHVLGRRQFSNLVFSFLPSFLLILAMKFGDADRRKAEKQIRILFANLSFLRRMHAAHSIPHRKRGRHEKGSHFSEMARFRARTNKTRSCLSVEPFLPPFLAYPPRCSPSPPLCPPLPPCVSSWKGHVGRLSTTIISVFPHSPL